MKAFLKRIKWNLYIRYISLKAASIPSVLTKVIYNHEVWSIAADGRLGSGHIVIRKIHKEKNKNFGKQPYETKYNIKVIKELLVSENDVIYIMNVRNFIRSYKYYVSFYKRYWLNIFIMNNKVPDYCPILSRKKKNK